MDQATHNEHKTHTPTFVGVFIMLCALTAISYWIASSDMMDTAPVKARGLMIAVSAAKAMLVVVFFMHLWWEKAWKYVLTLPALILALVLVMLLIPDIGMRTKSYSNDRKLRAPQSVEQDSSAIDSSQGDQK